MQYGTNWSIVGKCTFYMENAIFKGNFSDIYHFSYYNRRLYIHIFLKHSGPLCGNRRRHIEIQLLVNQDDFN